MAALIAILAALGRSSRRDLRTLLSVAYNNFFFAAALVAYGALAVSQFPTASMPFFFLLVLLLLFPSSADPLNRIPSNTLSLWPLSRGQRVALRVTSLAFSPNTWLAVAIVITLQAKAALVFLVFIAGIRSMAFAGFRIRNRWAFLYPPRLAPPVPAAFGRTVRLNLRQLSCVLDFYLAVILSLVATGYRLLAGHPDPAAYPVMAILAGVALSTYAQSLFGLDGPGGLTRYRLLSLPGWKILLAKDAAFLAVAGVLSLPLSLPTGITFALVALVVGRYPSLALRVSQQKWRFARGDARFGLAQLFLATGIASAESQIGKVYLLAAFAVWVISLALGGWYIDRHK